MLQKIQIDIQIGITIGGYSPPTVRKQDNVHCGHLLQLHDHNGRQTCVQNLTIHVHKELENPANNKQQFISDVSMTFDTQCN